MVQRRLCIVYVKNDVIILKLLYKTLPIALKITTYFGVPLLSQSPLNQTPRLAICYSFDINRYVHQAQSGRQLWSTASSKITLPSGPVGNKYKSPQLQNHPFRLSGNPLMAKLSSVKNSNPVFPNQRRQTHCESNPHGADRVRGGIVRSVGGYRLMADAIDPLSMRGLPHTSRFEARAKERAGVPI